MREVLVPLPIVACLAALVAATPTGRSVALAPISPVATVAPADTPPASAAGAAAAAAAAAPYDALHGLSSAQIETFLREARVVAVRPIGAGVTRPWRATLDDGRIRHDAAVQAVDACEADAADRSISICDSFRFNVAAYEIGKLLGLTSIPPSVERPFEGRRAAFTWWIDDAHTLAELELGGLWQPTSAEWLRQQPTVRIFDELISNADRHQANLLQDPRWWVWMIDHSRAFRPDPRLRNPERLRELGADALLVARLRALDAGGLERCCAAHLTSYERAGVLARRDSIVALFP